VYNKFSIELWGNAEITNIQNGNISAEKTDELNGSSIFLVFFN